MIMLTERQLLILQMIIDDFTEFAHPVGSRAISKKEAVNLSAATVRNVMADLEDLGYLEKMHSSSGRIPSEKGYRYYVDHIISPTVKQLENNIARKIVTDQMYEFEHVVQTTAEVLSQLTNYTSIIIGNRLPNAKLKNIQLISLSRTTVVAILVTDTGHVEHKTFSVPEMINVSDLEKMVNILNDRLIGVPIYQLEQTLRTEVYDLVVRHMEKSDQLFHTIVDVISSEPEAKLFVGGQSNLLMQPEFQDVHAAYELLTMLENEDQLIQLLQTKYNGLTVTIGNENEMDAIKHLSLITSPFQIGIGDFGTIALLGPTRMQYKKVIQLLHQFANELTDIFSSDDQNHLK